MPLPKAPSRADSVPRTRRCIPCRSTSSPRSTARSPPPTPPGSSRRSPLPRPNTRRCAGPTSATGRSPPGRSVRPACPARAMTATARRSLRPTMPATGRSEERRVGKECRSRCDWSSDVCSSDLYRALAAGAERAPGMSGARYDRYGEALYPPYYARDRREEGYGPVDPWLAQRRARQLAVALERLRWLPRHMPPDRIIVNTATQRLYLFEDDRPVFTTKVVVGKPTWQTPEFHATI